MSTVLYRLHQRMTRRDALAQYLSLGTLLFAMCTAFADERACSVAVQKWAGAFETSDVKHAAENVIRSCEAPAKAGSVEAQFHMADFLKMKDESRAKEWAQLAAAKYYMPAVFLLSEFESNEIEKLKLIRRAADAGYPKAQFRLGELYDSIGNHVLLRDEKLSVEWKTRAAQGGFRKAQLELGRMYEDSESPIRDEEKAQYWFKRAQESEPEPLLEVKLDPAAFWKSMRFLPFFPCEGSGCRLSILGIGRIEADSAEKLAALNPPTRVVLYLHSPGGNLAGGLRLGGEIRRRGLYTRIATSESADELGILVRNPVCASSCAYAFLGGVVRTLARPQALLFHQFSSASGLSQESDTQETVAVLNSYVDEMGISRKALDPALLNRPEQLGVLSEGELREYKVVTPDLTDTLSFDELSGISAWKLEFGGSAPKVVMSRPTNYSNGSVSVALSRGDRRDKYKLSVEITWNDDVEQADVEAWREVVFDSAERPLEGIVCSEANFAKYNRVILSCKNPLFSVKASRSMWRSVSTRGQRITYDLSGEQYEIMLAKRPQYLELDDPTPFFLREMFVSHEFILTEDFFKLAGLIRWQLDGAK